MHNFNPDSLQPDSQNLSQCKPGVSIGQGIHLVEHNHLGMSGSSKMMLKTRISKDDIFLFLYTTGEPLSLNLKYLEGRVCIAMV